MIKNPMDMSGYHVLVTGASSGIGKATSILLAELGCKVILIARNEERLRDSFVMLPGNGHLFKACDLSRVENIEPMLRGIVDSVGLLDGLVHCAGIQRTMPIRFEKPAVDDPLWRINYHAAVGLITSFRKPSIHSQRASVVLVSSIMGIVGESGVSSYCASKGALHAFGRAAAIELSKEKIRVNCVAPGHVNIMSSFEKQPSLTAEQYKAIEEKHPLGIGKAEDVANAIAFLLADTGRWITGTVIVVDGGYTAR